MTNSLCNVTGAEESCEGAAAREAGKEDPEARQEEPDEENGQDAKEVTTRMRGGVRPAQGTRHSGVHCACSKDHSSGSGFCAVILTAVRVSGPVHRARIDVGCRKFCCSRAGHLKKERELQKPRSHD